MKLNFLKVLNNINTLLYARESHHFKGNIFHNVFKKRYTEFVKSSAKRNIHLKMELRSQKELCYEILNLKFRQFHCIFKLDLFTINLKIKRNREFKKAL